MKKQIFKITRILIISVIIYLCGYTNTYHVAEVKNNNIDRQVNLSAMSLKISEFNYDELYSAKSSFSGDLTGYVYNCPACSGHLACASKYNIMDGTVTYPDDDYGVVNIVASSSNLPCGTIIRFNSVRISDSPVYAIVLDRGVIGTSIDFLSRDIDYAIVLGRSNINYDVLRNGWGNES